MREGGDSEGGRRALHQLHGVACGRCAPAGRNQHRVGGGPSAVAGERKPEAFRATLRGSLQSPRATVPSAQFLAPSAQFCAAVVNFRVDLFTFFLCVVAPRLLSLSLSFTFRSDLG